MIKLKFFDLHCDTPYECFTKNKNFYSNNLAVSGENGLFLEEWKQIFAFWIRDDAEQPFLLYKQMLNDFKTKLSDVPHNLLPLFSVEGGAILENDSDNIFELKRDNIKLLTLTWNGENNIAGGINSTKGLTSFGKTVIQKMNRLKIGCDLSHLNDKSFFEALENAEYPLATHSNCRKICNNPRNLSDRQIKSLCERGGIIGICPYPLFLGGDVFEKIYENIFLLLDKGYENNISKKLSNISEIGTLYSFLEQKKLKKCLIDKIFFENANNYIAKLN